MNISELATHLNLSVTTVSRVLSGVPKKYRISEKTAERVRQAAEVFGVVPDALGTSLKRGKTGMIGLIVPDITNPFFSEMAREIEKELRKEGKALILSDSNEDVDTEVGLLNDLMSRRLDGILIAPVGVDTPTLRRAINQESIPVVLLDRVIPGLAAHSVSIDNAEAGKIAVNGLIERGHFRIGCLRGDTQTYVDSERFRGVITGLKAAGYSTDDTLFAGDGYSLQAGISGAKSLLGAVDRPTAVITLNGQGILALLQVARAMELRIPEDFSVVAFDEQPWSPFINPPITTISQPVGEMAQRAVALLEEVTGRSGEPRTIVFSATMIHRSSVMLN